MTTYARKKLVASDIISNLPCNILDNILTCLPLEDAIRTSVLSKNWRFRWHHSPQLVFDDDYFLFRSLESPHKNFVQIFNVLLLHRGPLRKFVLLIPSGEKIKSSFMNLFIVFLTGKDVQEFTFRPPFNKPYGLPSTFFQCKQLTHLNLSDCVFNLPHEFMGFIWLISIEVDFSRVSPKSDQFNSLISKCPLLQRLEVKGRGVDTLEIDAPNLKFFHYHSGAIFTLIFKNVPVLSTVIITRFCSRTSKIVELFGSLPAIEHLVAYPTFLVPCLGDIIPERLPTLLNHLTYFELTPTILSYLELLKTTLLLIRSSPYLRKLKIEVLENDSHDDTASVQHLKALTLTEDPFNQLEEVTMLTSLWPVAAEVEFAKFILAKSPALKKFTIQTPRGISTDSRLKIVTAVDGIQRASTKAEVIFLVVDIVE